MRHPRNTRSVIPNLFTAMNLFCGFFSIINASEQSYIYAAWLIIIAGVFDALDGIMARLTNSSSKLGVELDSLADLLSFGAAPAFLIYKTFLFNYTSLGVIISSLLVIAGGFRLARFNVQLVGFDKSFFKGLPIPSSAITIASFILIYYKSGSGFSEPFSDLIIPLVLLLSFLMVSTIKYDTLPKFTKKEIQAKPFHFIFILASIILLAVTSGKALFFIFVFIILFGIFRHIFYSFSKKNRPYF
ncbi:MAG: CDP-diacylglycerol--serine O-phosphatidyltransferase [Ignavibacteriaceae bacterium]